MTIAAVTTTTTTANTKTACLKRKRCSNSQHVRFSKQPQSIIYTYSQSDYDRSGLLPEIQPQHEKQQFILALAFNFVHPSSTEQKPTYIKKSSRNKRPTLSIDTSNLHGPLYFTKMTTHHQKSKPFAAAEEDVDMLTKENTRRNSLPLAL